MTSFVPIRTLATAFGNVVVTFLSLNRVRLESFDRDQHVYHDFMISTTKITIDIVLGNINGVWAITENTSHKANSYSVVMHNDLPKTVNAKLEQEILKTVVPFVKNNRALCVEGEKWQLETSLSSVTRDVEDLETKLKEALKNKLQLEQKLADLK